MSRRIPIRRRARVRRVLAALSDLQAYDDAQRGNGRDVREGQVDYLVFHRLLESRPLDDWNAGKMRAFLVAACVNCPDETLTAWAEMADDELAAHRNVLARDTPKAGAA